MFFFRALTFSFCLFLLTLSSGRASAQTSQHTLTHGDLERTYTLQVPASYSAARGAPLLIALHQTGSSGPAMAALTGLNTQAERFGFIVAYPNSYDPSFNDGRAEAGLAAQTQRSDDVGFITALVEQLAADYTLSAVYVVGHGTGGLMAFRLACERADLFDGMVVVGARLWVYQQQACIGTTAPLKILIVNGSQEPQSSQPTPASTTILDEQQTFAFWALRQGCERTNTATTQNAFLVVGCAGDQPVAYYAIANAENRDWPHNRPGRYRLNRLQIDTTEIILNFLTDNAAWQVQQQQLFGVFPRTSTVYVPTTYNPAQPMPAVLVLHGRPGTGTGMVYITEMNAVAEAEGFIAIYPNGVDQTWNYARGIPGYETSEVDDVRYLADLVDDLSLDLNIDPQRVYVTGFSNGGFMVHRLACELSMRFAAFAVVAASAFSGQPTLCDNFQPRPVPILLIQGTADTIAPWEGLSSIVNTPNGPQPLFTVYPFEFAVNFWAVTNQCDGEAEPAVEDIAPSGSSPETTVRRFSITACAAGSRVEIYIISEGGHNWPGVAGVLAEDVAGNVSLDISASQVIWDFFAQHRLDN